ncbi:zinc finger protein 318 isoform X3 [Cottoperca gobio]|uniref:Zinc finger protein 318 isoform X2 n=1 Tax=Cottoperca gobio TaxID=56716 RepID=A0A6J2PA23_COTGO|nr:zinc finger protein 318 isoform X2 [Cottoperca gobio]XP_029282074.1 zinc finger protein 318 isoform X3 [Cottoperca gobio]
MYRGRPPPRGGYRPPFEGRGLPPPRPYPEPGYRDDRSRPRPPYHPGYHDHGHPDSYRRSPPRRRYPSPGSGSHRSGEYWTGGPPRERSPSPRGSGAIDHNLVITVGNELTGPSGSAPSRHHDRDYAPRPEYERSRSRPHSRSPDRSRAKSLGRSKSQARSKSRPRSQSRSPDRSRAKSRGRSKSRSPDRSRAKSRGRSKSRSPDRSRAKSQVRSKSRPRSRSRSRSRGRSHGRSKSRPRSRSASSSSSSSSGVANDDKSRKEFKELDTARRRKELEEMLSLPTKSILKKRNDSEDSPSLRTSDSPRGSNISRVADQLLQAVKGMEPHMVASMLSELRSDPQMAHRVGLDAEIREILHMLGGQTVTQEKTDDIDDEEKFLYGDSEDPKLPAASELVRHQGLDLYGDVTEEALYGDYPPQNAVLTQTYGLPPGASPHLHAHPTMGEVDVRYASRSSISPDRNIMVQVANPAFPPGTEPLKEGERQALEEYEKIQDLLKTIGLDLGVTEISKMAARTKERLHGNKPPPKTPTRSRRHSSGSSDGDRGRRRRSHSGSSSSSNSRCRSRGRGGSWSSDDSRRKRSAPAKSHKDMKELNAEQSAAPPPHNEAPPQIPDTNILPPHPGVPIPSYPPSQVHGMMPPNFPPPGYSQYGNYLPYMHQQWPPMYPPPSMALPPQTGPDDFPPTLSYQHPYNNPSAAEPGAKGATKGKVSSQERKVSEEQNNESQKQKVLEEREKLKQEREIRMKKKEYLMKELERLRKQQGELLRKKRREKGGHKDPLLQEISHLQEDVMAQISSLRKEHEAAEKNRNEIEKIALILGLIPSDRPRRAAEPEEPEKKKREAPRSPEGRPAASSSTVKQPSAPSRASPEEPPAGDAEPFEYYDAGNHWCKNCNVTSGSMFDFFTHLHSKTHRKTLDPYDRPWASTPNKIAKNLLSEEKLTKPAKGSEFLLPVRGFYCLLCRQFYGDAICAEEHVTRHAHNEKYKKQMYENPLYEQRRNLDRQAGLTTETSGKKRKHEEEEKVSKDKEEKSKHKKEKKEKKKEEVEAVQTEEKVKKEAEEVEKPSKKEEDFKTAKSLEEERPSHSKKDEEEKYKCSKKDDKYRHSREEEERGKHSRRDEDDRYKYSREEEYRHRYDDRYDSRPKYGPRDDEYKHGKYSDSRSKYDRERDEGKLKAEKEAFKKLPPEKPATKPDKPEPPPKPYDAPKILCGPSPAMRAKLRKQTLETAKPAPAVMTTTMTPTFGKFTWKKRENFLAKEAEKVAAEFIKEDEAAAKQNPVSVEDSFAKSMAVAKEIAQKLGGHQTPPWVSNGANRGRIRPNLPAPAAVMRKTAMMGKPAPLNTFLSMRPQNTGLPVTVPEGSPISDDLEKTLNAQKTVVETKPQLTSAGSGTSEAVPPPPMLGSAPFEAKLSPRVFGPAPFEAKLSPRVFGPAPFEVKPAPPICNPAPPVSKPATSAPSETAPFPKLAQPTMMKIVSDVAAPGVPEGEQTRTVFVKPPPFMNMGDGAQKSEKLKSHLAAAKAQDLFDIFYSKVDQSGAYSITKPATDARADVSSTNKSQLLTTIAPKPQPHPLTQRQPPPVVFKPPQDSQSAQTQQESNIQIASVWSLQPAQTPTPEETQKIQPKCNPPAPPESQSEPQNQPSPPKSESQIAPQTKPAELEPTPQTQSSPNLAPDIQSEPQPDQDPQLHLEPQPDQDPQLHLEPQPDQDPQLHLEPRPDSAPEPAPKPGPKTRGKRTPPAPRPVRQTRSQTRYQTRRKQQSEPEPEPASGDSDSAVSDPKGLDASDPGSGLQPGEGAPGEDTPMTEITPETLGLPSDMTSLDFDYDFNFE